MSVAQFKTGLPSLNRTMMYEMVNAVLGMGICWLMVTGPLAKGE
jgi:hypothetical protein